MLKNILSLLLSKFYSKKENETISHLATPNIANTVNVMLTTTESSAIVAPFDGYFNIETTAEGNPTINIWEALWCNATPQSPFQAKVFVPVTKGQRIQYRITGTISQARFVRLVGGGYQALKKLLLQGGGLCRLSHWYSSLRRSSCRVRKNGCSKTLSPLKETQLLSQIKDRVLHLLRTLLRQTDCLEFGIKQVRGISLHCLAIATVTEEIRPDGNFLRLTDGQLKTHFMYLREKSLNLIQTATRQVLPECGSTRRLNSAVGGASC